MKEYFKIFFKFIFKIFYFVFSYESMTKLKRYKNVLYSYWIRNSFHKCGPGFYVKGPIYLKGGKYITIGNNFIAEYRFRLEAWDEFQGVKYNPQILIGDNVVFNPDCHIGCIDKIEIGNNVLFASKVFIEDCSHGKIDKISVEIPPTERILISKGPIVIEDNVWVGESVAILPNVRIGKNSVIGANAVVTKSFPPYSIIGGNPAKLIKNLAE